LLAEVAHFDFLKIKAETTDICVPAPTVEAMSGAAVNNGDCVFIMRHFRNASTGVSAIGLTVRATDSSNDSSSNDRFERSVIHRPVLLETMQDRATFLLGCTLSVHSVNI
jgi:hypothetical protein